MSENASNATTLGYVRVSTLHQSNAAQEMQLVEAGVPAGLIYSDQASGSAGTERPGLEALISYARSGDTIVVVGIDRLGRSVAEVSATISMLSQRGIVLRSIREGISTDNPTGRMIASVLASVAELELELGKERRAQSRAARRAAGLSVGRPKALTSEKAAQLCRLARSGEPVAALAETFGISARTAYRIIRENQDASGEILTA